MTNMGRGIVVTVCAVIIVYAPSKTVAEEPAKSVVLSKLGTLESGGESPDFSALAFDDRVFHLKGLLKEKKGPEFVVISFWSTTCKHCRKGLLGMDRLAGSNETRGVHFVLVSCDPKAESGGGTAGYLVGLRRWLDEAGLKNHWKKTKRMWLLWDPDLAIAKRFQVFRKSQLTLPHTFVISREGHLVRIISGEGEDFDKVLRDALGLKGHEGGSVNDSRKKHWHVGHVIPVGPVVRAGPGSRSGR